MIRWIYNLGIRLFDVLILLASFRKEKVRLMREGRKKTFALLDEKLDSSKNYLWVHAASLGEFEQGRPVIEGLKKQNPELGIVLTFFSPSGYEVRKNYQGADIVCYLPSDNRRNVNDFLALVEPVAAVFVKYEFWPNYLLELSKNKVPVYLISAIFRPNQLFFKAYGSFYLNLLTKFSKIFVQDNESLNLLKTFGITNSEIAGDTRFDRVVEISNTVKKLDDIECFANGDLVVVAGSTWPADEQLLSHLDLSKQKLIVVPHEIADSHLLEIENIFHKEKCVRLSVATEIDLKLANCLIVDSIGLLSSIYQYAKWAYIGGGFGVGIHNTLEAAVFGKAVVFGPNFMQFREARELIACEGGFSVKNANELLSIEQKLKESNEYGQNAGRYTKQNTGATEKILKELNRH